MRQWRIHPYSTNIWVFNPVYKYRFTDFESYWLKTDSMWLKQIPGEYVLMRVTVHKYSLLYMLYVLLIKMNHMNFCPRLPYANGCVQLRWEVFFFIATFLFSDNFTNRRLNWMGAYCTSKGPVKLTNETFHCCCDRSKIFYTRGYGKVWAWEFFLEEASQGMGVIFGESIA